MNRGAGATQRIVGGSEADKGDRHVIRPATHDDLDYLLSVAREYMETSYEGAFLTLDESAFRGYLAEAMHNPQCVFLVDDQRRGSIIGIISESAWNRCELCARVVSLWVVPAHRGGSLAAELIAAFEQAVGNVKCVMLDSNHAFSPEATGRLYRRLGYEPVQTLYVKVPKHGH